VGGQFEVAGKEIGMEVRLDHPFDPQPELGGIIQVAGNIALRIDHDGSSARLVTDQV
jgi:hypothetical protein